MAFENLFRLSLITSSIGGTFLIYKRYFAVPVFENNSNLTDKIAIVTGASSGIGQEIAFQLAQHDATVIMACRDRTICFEKRAKIIVKTKNKKVFCSAIDLEDNDSIRDFVTRVKKRVNKVDILVHNAGFKGGKKRETCTNYVEKQLQVNALSTFLLTKELLPLLEKSDSEYARVVMLICPQYSSGVIDIANINFQKSYDRERSFNQSQLIKMLITQYFSITYKNKIVFNAVNPGITFSNFHKNENYNQHFTSRNLFRYINWILMRNVWQGAYTPLWLCCSDDVEGASGRIYQDLKEIELHSVAQDLKMMDLMAQFCDKWTNTRSAVKQTGSIVETNLKEEKIV